jgi:ElaA protein
MTVIPPLHWKLSLFEALSLQELHDLLQLRTQVFVVEQNCVFQDIDGSDGQALHLLGLQGPQLVVYARCFPAGVKFEEASIGRVLTRESARGRGLGHALIAQAIVAVSAAWGAQPIRVGAQARLKNYYCQHGFIDLDRPYVEDGIDHLEMLWQPV